MSAEEVYKRELLKWNERINLIGPEARANLDAHINEALAAADILQPQRNVLDFGSGGGLPAIPMAIAAPAAKFWLVEPDPKKWGFLKHASRAGASHSSRARTTFPRSTASDRARSTACRAARRTSSSC